MPKIQASLSISVGDTSTLSIRGHLNTSKKCVQSELEKIGFSFELYGSKENEYYVCNITGDLESEKIRLVQSILLEAGIKESSQTVIPKDKRETHFAMNLVRSFTKKELDQAEYLRLNVKGLKRIADWKETTADGYVLKINNRLKNTLDFGWLDVVVVPYVSETGREKLEGIGFDGIHFKSAMFDGTDQTVKQLFELTSNLVMPECLLPIQNNDGDIVCVNYTESARIWDDAGRVQPILKYRREDIEAMGTFDIAKTLERVGNLPQHYKHHYIVSQRFRKYLEAMKVRSVEFVPVEVVDFDSAVIDSSRSKI